MTEQRYKYSYDLALKFCVENIESVLNIQPNRLWEQEKEELIFREAFARGLRRANSEKAA